VKPNGCPNPPIKIYGSTERVISPWRVFSDDDAACSTQMLCKWHIMYGITTFSSRSRLHAWHSCRVGCISSFQNRTAYSPGGPWKIHSSFYVRWSPPHMFTFLSFAELWSLSVEMHVGSITTSIRISSGALLARFHSTAVNKLSEHCRVFSAFTETFEVSVEYVWKRTIRNVISLRKSTPPDVENFYVTKHPFLQIEAFSLKQSMIVSVWDRDLT